MKPTVSLFFALLLASTQGWAQWSPWANQATGLPEGYYVSSLHAVDDNVVWGLALNDRILSHYVVHTTNGGATWTCGTISPASDELCVTGIFGVSAVKAWVSMGKLTDIPAKPSGGLFCTTDGGVTWKKDTTALIGYGGSGNFIYFFDADNGLVVGNPADGYFEIYTTSNGGTSWSRAPKANIPSPLGVEFGVPGEFSAAANCLWFPTFTYPGSQARYIRTTNKGLTWSANVFPNRSSKQVYTILEFQNDSIGLGQGSPDGVMKTRDGGLTWTLIPNTSWLLLQNLESVPTAPGMYVGTSPFNAQSSPERYIWGTVATTDGGSTWTRIGQGATQYADLSFGSSQSGWRTCVQNSNIQKFSISPGRLIGASPDSVSYPLTLSGEGRSADTVSVDIANFGTDPLQVTSIVAPGSNFKIVQQPTLPLTLTTLKSARLTLTFTPQAGGMLNDSIIVISNASNPGGSRIFLSGRGFFPESAEPGILYASSESLHRINASNHTTSRIDTLGAAPMQALAVDASGALHGMSAKPNVSTLYRIDCATAATMPVRVFPVGDIRAIAFGPGNLMYGATVWGDLYHLDVATGAANYIGSSSDVTFTSLAFSPRGRLWASAYLGSTYDNIFTVNVATGEATLVGRTGKNTHILSIAFDAGGTLYGLSGAGADTNYIIKIDTLTGTGTSLFSTGATGLAAMATRGQGLTSVGAQPRNGIASKFALDQNYPNPFNPTTTIKYGLPRSSMVRLSVHDLLGREVSVLVNERRDAGVYEVKFDASELASGVYLYRLQAGDFVRSRKLLVLR